MEFIIGAVVIYFLYKLLSGGKSTAPIGTSRNPTIKRSTSTPSNKDIDEEEESFATFQIYTRFGSEPEKSSNKTKGRWLSEDEKLNINGRLLTRGFFYFGGVMESLSGYGIEPSLIDEKRPVSSASNINEKSEIYTDETLGYWPSYASLSKGCRGAFLDWLASERSNPNTPMGYVFIYFYGFERRVIENKSNSTVSDQEFMSIFDEVLRLNQIYNDNRSFRGYSSNFLELMTLLRPALLEQRMAKIPDTNNALSFKLKLARTVVNEHPIGAELALDWLKNTFEYSLKMPARRCEEEYKSLFKIRFENKFGNGVTVKPNKTKLHLSYHAASSSIQNVDLAFEDLPDPSILKGPINKFVPIAELCAEELNNYSRYLGKAGSSKDDIAALMLLPDELANESNSPIIESFRSWAQQVIRNNEGLTTVKEFWSHIGTALPSNINKKENDLILSLAAKASVGIAPDPRFHQTKLKADGEMVLFAPGYGEFFEPSKAFHQVEVAIRLGAMVATIDGNVDNAEKLVLQKLIEHDDKLSPTEKNSLKAYLIWRLNTPANISGLKTRIEQLKSIEIEFLKRFIISIALADGRIDSSEIKQIEKLYTTLGLDKSLVSSDIHNLTTTNTSTKAETRDSDFKLDDAILAIHESDTNDAKNILESIFSSDDEAQVETAHSVQQTENGLDKAHKELYEILLNKEKWQREEVYELCIKLNLMLDGAIETINDWAYEKVDAPVLDDDGDIYIDLEIVEELKG